MYHVLRHLARRHELTVLSFWRSEEARAGLAQLAGELDCRVVPVSFARLRPNRQLLPGLLRRWRGARAGRPADIALWDQPAMHAAIDRELAWRPADIIQIEWPYLAPYALARPQLPSLLITHDIFSVGIARRAALARPADRHHLQTQAAAWRRYEQAIYPQFGAVAAMSDADADTIRSIAPDSRIVVLPNGVDTEALTPGAIRPHARHLLFVGSPTHEPNLDAACWLLSDIWPELHRQRPELRLTLVNLDHPRVRALAQPGVEISGRLPDLVPIYRQADIALAPIRAGSGTRLKILEAFALGVPVISTTVGCEGLVAIPERDLLVADAAPDVRSAILRLLADADLRARLAANARSLAVAQYDWRRVADLHDAAYAALSHEWVCNLI